MDTVKYDRQIRLFGVETQEKLRKMKVQLIGTPNLISAEILKNVVLLGVVSVVASKEIIEEVKKIVPDPLRLINPDLVLETSEQPTHCDFAFLVDTIPAGTECSDQLGLASHYFVCSKCLTVAKGTAIHPCEVTVESASEARQCMVGAFAVQEFIKHTQGKYSVDLYRLNF